MDTLTHTVLGACTGQAIAGHKIGKKAMVIGALVNNFPDLDMIANFWHRPAEALLSHRGLTHSIIFIILICPFLIFIFRKLFPSAELSFNEWLLLVGHGLILHIGLDACTTYGTGWFEPFNHYRVSFNTLFIIDPFFMLPILLGTIILMIQNAKNKTRNKVALSALSLSGLYLLITLFIKIYVTLHIQSQLQSQNISRTTFSSSPTAFNNILWYVLVNQDSAYKTGYYSLLDKNANIELEPIAGHHKLLGEYAANSDVQCLLQFSKGYYQITKISEDSLRFSDLRFGQMAVDHLSEAPFVFRFDLTKIGKDTLVKQTPFQKTGSAAMKALYERAKGKR